MSCKQEGASDDLDVLVSVSHTPDETYLTMVWQEFFVSRGRGLTLGAHFPWITGADPPCTFVTLARAGEVVGGLTVIDRSAAMSEETGRIGAIGLVVVRPDVRGRGYSGLLLKRAIDSARDSRYVGLTLWTSKHAVYSPYGFELADEGMFGTVLNASPTAQETSIFSRSPREADDGFVSPGLPPFARDIARIRHRRCTLVVLSDGRSDILAQAEGSLSEVADALTSLMPRNWMLNSTRGDPLIEELESRGLQLNMQQSRLQMWMSLHSSVAAADLAAKRRFSVLDRI
jgi:GNAT superfamily N-acetyltransferase